MTRTYIFFLLAILTLGCKDNKQSPAESDVDNTVTEEAPFEDPFSEANLIDNIKLFDLDNNVVDLNQFAGKRIFLNFWATWCKPCIMEMPSIERAQELLEPEGYVFLLASDEDAARINRFKASKDFELNFIRVETSFPDMGILSIPTTLIIDEQGKIVLNHVGAREWDSPQTLDQLRSLNM